MTKSQIAGFMTKESGDNSFIGMNKLEGARNACEIAFNLAVTYQKYIRQRRWKEKRA